MMTRFPFTSILSRVSLLESDILAIQRQREAWGRHCAAATAETATDSRSERVENAERLAGSIAPPPTSPRPFPAAAPSSRATRAAIGRGPKAPAHCYCSKALSVCEGGGGTCCCHLSRPARSEPLRTFVTRGGRRCRRAGRWRKRERLAPRGRRGESEAQGRRLGPCGRAQSSCSATQTHDSLGKSAIPHAPHGIARSHIRIDANGSSFWKISVFLAPPNGILRKTAKGPLRIETSQKLGKALVPPVPPPSPFL